MTLEQIDRILTALYEAASQGAERVTITTDVGSTTIERGDVEARIAVYERRRAEIARAQRGAARFKTARFV